jgi:hypothetical protein
MEVRDVHDPMLSCVWATFARADDADAISIRGRRIVFTSLGGEGRPQTLSALDVPTYSGVHTNIKDLNARRWFLPVEVSTCLLSVLNQLMTLESSSEVNTL